MLPIVLSFIIVSWLAIKRYTTWTEHDLLWNIKWTIAYCYLRFLRFNSKPLFEFESKSSDSGRNGLGTLPEAVFFENPRQLSLGINVIRDLRRSHDEKAQVPDRLTISFHNMYKAVDSISFSTVSNYGDILVVRLSRRHGRCARITVYIKLGPQGDEYHLPIQPQDLVYNTDGRTFNGAGLSFEILEPLRCWRITFNGFLRKGSRTTTLDNNDVNVVPAKFNFLWHPMYDYVAFPHDFDPTAMAAIFASQRAQDLFCNPNELFTQEWYHQFGVIIGTLNIDGKEETELLLRGLKSRNHGVTDWKKGDSKVSITGIMQNGLSFHASAEDATGFKNFTYGYVLPPCNTKKQHINHWHNELKSLQHLQEEFKLQFRAGNKKYNLHFLADESQQFITVSGDCETTTKVYIVEFNGKKGRCLLEVSKPCNVESQISKNKSLPFLQGIEIETCNHLVLMFDNEECKCSNIVGGKGASLALLASIKHNDSFVVPEGFCVTKKAFTDHLTANQSVANAISSLESVAWNKTDGNLKDECNKLVQLLHTNELSENLKEVLHCSLRKTFGEDYETCGKYAVRSSAIGEDGEELSAAGQNETFLGVKTFHNICEAVIKCWASQFSHRSVEYKRQNGQHLNGGIGVVIQQMIPADIAGVLFTRHPITDSTSEIMIASNYGLGESVVSATTDPDTVIVSRTFLDQVYVKDKQIGSKKTKITMADHGTVSIAVGAYEASKCSMSDDVALKLATIAIDLEKRYGGSRDIEWAVNNDEVYLLQSRPVTSENPMTDFEIIHEFDFAPRTDNERYSTANYSEVMPGAVSPLTLSTFLRALFTRYMVMCGMKGSKPDLTIVDTLTVYFGHLVVDQVMQKFFNLAKKKSSTGKAMEIGLYGRLLDDDDVVELAFERFESPSAAVGLSLTKAMITGALFGKWLLRKGSTKYNLQYHVSMENSETIEEMFESIEKHFPDLEEITQTHVAVSYGSMVWNLLVLRVLSQGSETFNLDHYTDFATLIGTCNGTESGNLPDSILELANSISQDADSLEFQAMNPKKAAEWLNHRKSDAGEKYREFMKRHGHRGYKESDMRIKPYGLQPEKLTKVLQTMLKEPMLNQRLPQNATKDIQAKLKTHLTILQRTFLKTILSCVKTAICNREESKSRLIKVVDALRRAYTELALRLQHEGFLPDPELIHFLTHNEIAFLMKTRSARILQRARKRQLLFPSMDSIVLPEIICGIPKMLKHESINASDEVVQLTGYPVCQGIAQGFANVITSFEQVETLQIGDILITRATDIGWSPYFPMLKGVVTEIGGLISHGAVVAREFGLPCVVAVQNATQVFKTGDTVIINAINGTVTKIEA